MSFRPSENAYICHERSGYGTSVAIEPDGTPVSLRQLRQKVSVQERNDDEEDQNNIGLITDGSSSSSSSNSSNSSNSSSANNYYY